MQSKLKNFFYNVSGYLLRLVIFLGIIVVVMLIIFGSSRTIKQTLNTTNSYNRFVPLMLEENKQAQKGNSTFPLDDPKILEIFDTSFPSQDLKRNTELVIDSIYAWLNKQTPSLKFKVDFTENKRTYAHLLATYAFERYKALPLCKVDPAEVDPLTASCRVKNINVDESLIAYQDQIFQSSSFLEKTVFTQDDLPKNTSGKTIAQNYYFAPTVFTWLKRSPYIIIAVILVLSVDFVLLSTRKRRGVQNWARLVAGTGISIVIFPFFYSYVLPNFSKSFAFDIQTVGTQKIFSEIIDSLTKNTDYLFIVIGLIITAVGVIFMLGERITRPTDKYRNVEKSSGITTSNAKQPKDLRGKLSAENVPLQSSDSTRSKKVKTSSKYRTLNKKKELL